MDNHLGGEGKYNTNTYFQGDNDDGDDNDEDDEYQPRLYAQADTANYTMASGGGGAGSSWDHPSNMMYK